MMAFPVIHVGHERLTDRELRLRTSRVAETDLKRSQEFQRRKSPARAERHASGVADDRIPKAATSGLRRLAQHQKIWEPIPLTRVGSATGLAVNDEAKKKGRTFARPESREETPKRRAAEPIGLMLHCTDRAPYRLSNP